MKAIHGNDALYFGDSRKDQDLLLKMEIEARAYIRAFSWAPSIDSMKLVYGIGGIIAIFKAKFEQKIESNGNSLWIIVGDLPSAYLVTDDLPDAGSALEEYCNLMEEWSTRVANNQDTSDSFPVQASPTLENAEELNGRIRFLRKEVLPVVSKAE